MATQHTHRPPPQHSQPPKSVAHPAGDAGGSIMAMLGQAPAAAAPQPRSAYPTPQQQQLPPQHYSQAPRPAASNASAGGSIMAMLRQQTSHHPPQPALPPQPHMTPPPQHRVAAAPIDPELLSLLRGTTCTFTFFVAVPIAVLLWLCLSLCLFLYLCLYLSMGLCVCVGFCKYSSSSKGADSMWVHLQWGSQLPHPYLMRPLHTNPLRGNTRSRCPPPAPSLNRRHR